MKKSIKKIELKKKTISFLGNAGAGQLMAGNRPTSRPTVQSWCMCNSIHVPCDSQQVCDSINFC